MVLWPQVFAQVGGATIATFFGTNKFDLILFFLSQRRLEVQAREVTEALSRVGNVRGLSKRARVSYIRCVISARGVIICQLPVVNSVYSHAKKNLYMGGSVVDESTVPMSTAVL